MAQPTFKVGATVFIVGTAKGTSLPCIARFKLTRQIGLHSAHAVWDGYDPDVPKADRVVVNRPQHRLYLTRPEIVSAIKDKCVKQIHEYAQLLAEVR